MDNFINECREWILSIQASLDMGYTIDAVCKEREMFEWMMENVPESSIRSIEIELYKYAQPNAWDRSAIIKTIVAQTLFQVKSSMSLSF